MSSTGVLDAYDMSHDMCCRHKGSSTSTSRDSFLTGSWLLALEKYHKFGSLLLMPHLEQGNGLFVPIASISQVSTYLSCWIRTLTALFSW